MARKRTVAVEGTVVVTEHVSRLLKDNPLGDPHVRKLTVWLPAQYEQSSRRFPVLYDLVGFTGAGPAHLNWKAFSENLGERLSRLIYERKMPPVIVVLADCFTALGGNQYINSSAIGPYADYLTREIVPFVDRKFRTLASREHRGCFGKSSGGYGAMLHGMKYADTWGAIASHSGDAYFDFVYRSDWPDTLNELAKHRRPALKAGRYKPLDHAGLARGYDDGRVRRFLQAIWNKPKLSSGEVMALMNLAMAASYDPHPKAPLGFRLPANLETGEWIEANWARWRAHDPVHLVAQHKAALRSLRAIYIDCGYRDQYQIHYGSRLVAQRLREARIEHRYEEFDDDHSDVDYRMDISLPVLAKALA
ncbi:MAG TPA: alpha/beta hydrolase-fold protein [Polyangiales bacterium]|nr:alpha/beta hydrolase-fold protein [Polyangiales bacterium]